MPDDSAETSQPTHVKATRDDWLEAARAILIEDGVSEVKILTLSNRLGVSRSSFYWYFKDRTDLLEALLTHWEETNTAHLIRHTTLPAQTITEAVALYFRCFLDDRFFNHRVDFAIREWSRRDARVHDMVARNDRTRQEAICAMFLRHGYDAEEADIRARILYYQQIGYYALDLNEPLAVRQHRIAGYLYGFTGKKALPEEVKSLFDYTAEHLAEG